jgi:hypothetical protein
VFRFALLAERPQRIESLGHAHNRASRAAQRFPFQAARNASAVSRTPVSNGVASDQKAIAKRPAST